MVFWDLNTIRGLSFQQIVYWKINLLFVRAYEIVCMEKKVRCESFPLIRLKNLNFFKNTDAEHVYNEHSLQLCFWKSWWMSSCE